MINFRKAQIPELPISPLNPQSGDRWVIAEGLVGKPGQAMGVMGLTYSQAEAEYYGLVYKPTENYTVSVKLIRE